MKRPDGWKHRAKAGTPSKEAMIRYQFNIHAIVVIWKTPKVQPGCFGFTAHLPAECSIGCTAQEWLEGDFDSKWTT